MSNGNVSSELILLWFASVCEVLGKTASRLLFYAYKKYKNGNSVRRTYATVTILVREYPENYKNVQLQTSFSRERLIVSQRNFACQYRRSSPMTYFPILTIKSIKNWLHFVVKPLSNKSEVYRMWFFFFFNTHLRPTLTYFCHSTAFGFFFQNFVFVLSEKK